jgi:hypothetical protein
MYDFMQVYKGRHIYVGLPTHGLLLVVDLDLDASKPIANRAVVADRIAVATTQCGRVAAWSRTHPFEMLQRWRDIGWQVGEISGEELLEMEPVCMECRRVGRCVRP